MISWSMGGIWQWFLIRFIWYRGLCELWQVLELQCCASAIDLRLSRRRKKRSDKKTTKGVGQFTTPPHKTRLFCVAPQNTWGKKNSCFKSWSWRSMRALHMTLEVGFNLLAAASLSGRCAKVCAGAQNQIGWFCRACSQCHSREAKRVLHFYTDTSTRFCRQYTLYYVKFSSLEIVTLKGPLNLNLLLLTTLVVKCRHGLQLLCWCPVWAHHGRRLQEQANLSIDDESFSVLPTQT